MLDDSQIYELAEKMQIPLARVCFKDQLQRKKLIFNKGYVINLENSVDGQGLQNDGSHWICLQVNKYPNGKVEPIFFDAFGAPPSEAIKKFVKDNTGLGLPHTEKDVQSFMNSACGWFCLSFLHFINASQYRRSQNLYQDVSHYLDRCDDLNKSIDFKKNEFVLLNFFRSKNPALRKEINVISPTDEIVGEDTVKIPVQLINKLDFQSFLVVSFLYTTRNE